MDEGIHVDGSNLSGVSAVCTWEDRECQSPSSDTTPTTLTMEVADPTSGELLRTASLEQVQLKFNVEAARLLPLAIRYAKFVDVCSLVAVVIATHMMCIGGG